MSEELSKPGSPPAPRGMTANNTIAFPRELREVVSELYDGSALELAAINGHASNSLQFGPVVLLKLVARQTGKGEGEYVVVVSLRTDAARQLAATLTQLADEADKLEPVNMWTVKR